MASNITAPAPPEVSPPTGDDGTAAHASPVSQILNALPWAKLSLMTTSSAHDPGRIPTPTTTSALLLLLLLLLTPLLLLLYHQGAKASTFVSNAHLPSISPSYRLDPARLRALRAYFAHGVDYMAQARDAFGADAPYRMDTDSGEATMLPARRYANEVRSDARLSFVGPLRRSMHYNLRGFDIFRKGGMESHLVVDVVRQDLTRELGKVTGPLHEETGYVLGLLLGEDREYHEVELKSFIQEMVARLSSRVFLGEELCRNREWLDITISCTITNMTASAYLRMFPWFLRPLLNEVLPICRKMRAEQAKAAALILPIFHQRQALRARLAAAGASAAELKAAVKNDGLEWFERMASRDGRAYEPHLSQLTLSVAAIHTTSDLLTQMVLDLAEHAGQGPEGEEENEEGREGVKEGRRGLLAALRAEIVEVLGREGWKKTSLYGLKLLDSCIRETQRLKPIGAASMRREVHADMTLSDGTFLRKGSQIMVTGLSHWDPDVYPNPHQWDGYRFYRQQQQPPSQKEEQSQQEEKDKSQQQGQHFQSQQTAAVTTSPDHIAFGHGAHACPGRFFAVNEAKIALAHLVMKYDWEILPSPPTTGGTGEKGEKTKGRAERPKPFGFSMPADQGARIRVRRRVAEIDLDALPVA